MIAVFGAAWVILRRTIIGRRVIAFGSSPEAARFCGISEARLRMFLFVLVGLCVGIATLVFVTRVWTADGGIEDGFELKVIAAVVLGGTSLKGGRGTLLGTFAAVLLCRASTTSWSASTSRRAISASSWVPCSSPHWPSTVCGRLRAPLQLAPAVRRRRREAMDP